MLWWIMKITPNFLRIPGDSPLTGMLLGMHPESFNEAAKKLFGDFALLNKV